ncbi:MAG TPA: hypothetical protein VFR15_14410 [Chloroflexia bacterium]|nr:hypothetical protein [Chloroflexia bacterium]
MPRIDKADRRDEKRRKRINSKYMGVRYHSPRAGDSLVAFEVERKTSLGGKRVRKVKRKK